MVNIIEKIKRTIFKVKAGDPGIITPIMQEQIDFPNVLEDKESKQTIDTQQYQLFQVEGDSMITSHIFANDYILVKTTETIEEKLQLKTYESVVFRVNIETQRKRNQNIREEELSHYKLRKFLTYLDLRSKDDEALFENVRSMDVRSMFPGNKERFMKKITEARALYGEQIVILSTTYKSGERSYSFHLITDLYGRVVYRVEKEGEQQMLVAIRPENDDTKNFQEIVSHLSTNNAERFFYSISNEQAVIVYSEIFKVTKEHIRLVSNQLSPEITGDERYIDALKSFLNKENTKLDIFVYKYNPNNPIYSVLNEFKDKVIIKYSNNGTIFSLNDKTVNFCIGDNHALRLETDINERIAECNFNDKKSCTYFSTLFDEIFNQTDNTTLW